MLRKRPPQIVALGGGGFSMEPKNPRLDDYILGLAQKRRPRIAFVPTASGDADGYVERFLKAFPRPRAQASVLRLFKREVCDLEAFVRGQDVVYVGGGNTFNLLAIWRAHGLDGILQRAWRAGVVMAGVSAGALCWFECGVTDSFGPLAPLPDGLAFLPGSACPHYDGEPQRRPTYRRLVRAGLPAGYALDDGAAAHFVGRRLHACIASRPAARVHRVERVQGRVVETPLPTTLLARFAPGPPTRPSGSPGRSRSDSARRP